MSYTLHCRDESGELFRLRYDPHTSEFMQQDGSPVVGDSARGKFTDVVRISPASPGRKSSAPDRLKIQLGLRCNYTCSYCSQSNEIESATVTRTADADKFLKHLDGWLTGKPAEIEFWGGEPFLYFAKLKRLVPGLRERFPEAKFLIITNGSLIDGEIIEFVERHDIVVAVSHDGPGQHLRGPDPFDDPERARWLRELWRRRGPLGKMSFNVVLSSANCDVRETHEWFIRTVGDPDVTLHTEGVVSVYDGETLAGAGKFDQRSYETLHRTIVDAIGREDAKGLSELFLKAGDFVDSLYEQRPSSALGQKCGMDRAGDLAVDLSGQVMTCQNTGAKGKHGIGSVDDLAGVRLDTAWHWSNRECCNHCPVLQLCKGSCMYLEGDLFAQSCENEYRYNNAILAGVIKHITGLELERIEGDIRRPRVQKTIPIKSVSHAS